MNKRTPKNIDDYVGRFPKEVQQLLKTMRVTIRKAAPRAKETISYGIPTLTLDGKSISRRTKAILDFILVARASRHLRRSYRHTKGLKGRYSSPSTSRSRLLW